MMSGGERRDQAPIGSAGFHVYVLRDPRDGAVFFVGHGQGDDVDTISGSADRISSDTAAVHVRIRSIVDDGYHVERLVVAKGLSSESATTAFEQAILSAYQAAHLSPAGRVPAAHRASGVGSSIEAPLIEDAFDDPDVRQFAANAAAEIERLASSLSRAERDLVAASGASFLDGDHRGRLEALILQQESEIARLNAALDRVRAVRDLARWAGQASDGAHSDVTIRVGDLSRALE